MSIARHVGQNASWYSNPENSSSSEEILSTTFTNAKLLLRSIIKAQDYDALFSQNNDPNTGHSILDVQKCLRDAQNSYECRVQFSSDDFRTIAPTTAVPTSKPMTPLGKSKAKARLWLMGLSEKIVHYGNVFDVLAQHHPEYVSLAWGTFKLLFIAITNHAETASKLSKHISQISDLLPQQSLLLILYPTPQMQLSVARLFAHILNFFVSALKWYKDSRAMHVLKSVLQPWDLKFRNEYEAIASEAQNIRRLADVAMKAEVRDTRTEVGQGTMHLELMRKEMDNLRKENAKLQDLVRSRFEGMERSMVCMYKDLRVEFTAQRATLSRVHLNQMLSLPLWNTIPTSGESLQFCRSMRNRRRERVQLLLPDVKKLESWASEKNNVVLVIDTDVPITAKTFMVDLIDLILYNGMPIVWAMRYADYWDQRISIVDILRMLVLQTMQVGADRLLDSPFPVTVEQFREAASLGDWVAILRHLISGMNHTFIALDADLLAHATVHERGMILEMLDTLRMELPGNVKIVITMSSIDRIYAEELELSNACVRIQTGGSDWRRPRRQRGRKQRFRKR